MGVLFRFPFYFMGLLFWFFADLLVMVVQIAMIPSFHFSILEVFTFKTYRNGFKI
jgi:hypothetical protein